MRSSPVQVAAKYPQDLVQHLDIKLPFSGSCDVASILAVLRSSRKMADPVGRGSMQTTSTSHIRREQEASERYFFVYFSNMLDVSGVLYQIDLGLVSAWDLPLAGGMDLLRNASFTIPQGSGSRLKQVE